MEENQTKELRTYWPRAIFEAFAWGVGLFMLKQLSVFGGKSLESQKSWQNRVGNCITEELWGKIKEWGLSKQFDVLSPNRTPFQISVIVFDPLAPMVWGLGHKHGFEVFRVEIQYPNLFAMTIFDGDEGATKRSCYHTTEEQMLVDAKEILFYVVSKFMVERVIG